MSILENMLWPNRSLKAPERRTNLSLTDHDQWVELGLTASTDSGVSVNAEKALAHSAVFACVRILAETIASLPLIMYERMPRCKRRADKYPLYELLKERPNGDMTSFETWETLQGHLGLWGNAYSLIDYNGAGHVKEILPLRPDRMLQIVNNQGRWAYQYQMPTSEMKWFDEGFIWHLHGLGSDGRIGYSPIQLMRQAIGLGLAAEKYRARFFGNDARPGGVLEHPGTLSPEAHTRMREDWEAKHSGVSKSHKVAILEEGTKWAAVGIPPEDSQFIETRKFQLQEIARMYRIPPHMLADLDRATFSNIEHQSIEFVVHSIRPWLVRWEQSIKQRLMIERDRSRFLYEFLVDGLLRGDIVARYAAYAQGRQNGWLSANDIRELENMNPVDGGDVYLVPLNLIPARSAGSDRVLAAMRGYQPVAAELTAEPDPLPARGVTLEQRSPEGRRRLARAYHDLFAETAGKIVRREANEILQKAKALLRKRDVPALSLWLDQFYEEHRDFIHRQMQPVLRSYGELVVADAADEIGVDPLSDEQLDVLANAYVEDFAAHHIGISLAQVRSVLKDAITAGEDPVAALEARFGEWEEVRPNEIADIETVRSGNSMAVSLFAAAGVTLLRWHAFGKSCPYCSSMDGRVVGIQQAFLGAGSEFMPDGADRPMAAEFDVRHPPLHNGCDCMVTAEIG